MLAFAIYKNCWPGDYHALREGNSQIFTKDGVKCPQRLKKAKYGILLQLLTDQDAHLLTLHSVYYVGFDEKLLAEFYSKHWEVAIENPARHKEIIAELDTIQECETECLATVRAFFGDQKHLVKDAGGQPPEYRVDVFRAVINCMLRCMQKDNDWFFTASDYALKDKLKLLSEMNSPSDEQIKKCFFISWSNIANDKNNLFSAERDVILGMGILSEDEFRELCRGKKIDRSDAIKGISNCTNVTDKIIQIYNEFTASDATPYFSGI